MVVGLEGQRFGEHLTELAKQGCFEVFVFDQRPVCWPEDNESVSLHFLNIPRKA